MQKKYFKINLYMILGVIIIFWVLSYINRQYIEVTNKFSKIPNNLKVVNLGSSHGLYGIKYPKDIKGFNLALESQPLYYDLQILKKYSNKIDNEGIVILPISIFSFYQGKKIEYLSDRYYYFLNVNEIYLGSLKNFFLLKNFSVIYDSKKILSLFKYLKLSFNNRTFKANFFKWPDDLSIDKKLEDAKDTTKRHLGIDDIRFSQDAKISFMHLQEILEVCKKNKFKPVIITTPQSYLYNERVLEEDYEEKIYKHLKKLAKDFDFEYLDYSHDNRFEYNLDLFFDDDHLNEKGAELFTDILLKDLKKINIL